MTTKFGGVPDQRSGFTTMVDGAVIDDAIWGGAVVNVSQDAVQEFTVFRHQFDAQYGSALNAVVNVASKSGSNRLTGTAFYFGRDQRLAARNAFATTKQPFDQQRIGGSIGGAIVPNRTHFFSAYEYNNVDRTKILALPPSNPFAARENGTWPAGTSDQMTSTKVNHRINDSHSFFVRYLYDNQYLLRNRGGSESNEGDEFNKTHSLVGQEDWIVSQDMVNTLNVHYLRQKLGLTPYTDTVTISRPSITTGSQSNAPQFFPREHLTLSNVLYLNKARHSIKVGGSLIWFSGIHESFWDDQGTFSFSTDAPFDAADSRTWPFRFTIQQPAVWQFRSKEIAAFVQDDWRLLNNVRLNLGVRYDLNTNVRQNEFYQGLLDDPRYAGLDRFISRDRGTDSDNIQPRIGLTWDVKGTGNVVARSGFGVYTSRNRPWWQMTSQDLSKSARVLIDDPQRLRFFPDISAVLGGQSIEAIAAQLGRPLLLIADDFELPSSMNTTVGVGWRLNPVTSLDVDYTHDYGYDMNGSTDVNLPPSGRISATNPRPVPNFTQAGVIASYTKSWYDALELQLRTRVRGANSLQVSYALSRSYQDGVEFYSTYRGTERTPQEQGYMSNDTRHNLSVAVSTMLPWQINLSGIFQGLSGSPRSVSAGVDLDGDGNANGDRPVGLPPRVGRGDVGRELQIINDYRRSINLPEIDPALLKLDPNIRLSLRSTKAFSIGTRQRAEVFLEAYNVTNYVSRTGGTGNLNSRAMFIRTGARDARQIQWGVRYVF
jgi:hypothetical protein